MINSHLFRRKKPTLMDVARIAGVSIGSASKAISSPNAVRPGTLKKVAAAVEELGYVTDGRARALASNKSYAVGVVVPTVDNPIYANFIHCLQKALAQSRYQLIVSAHEYNEDTNVSVVRSLLERGLDGLVLVGTDQPPPVLEMLLWSQVPHVFCWSVDPLASAPCVGFSNFDASYQMAQHFLSLGHKRFALITGSAHRNERVRERIRGVRQALQEKNLMLDDKHIIVRPFTIEGGRSGLCEIFQLKSAPTVILCGTDLIAAGAIAEAVHQGIDVPNDVSIAGFDDIDLASLMRPSITTVHVPTGEIGQIAARKIVLLIEGKEVPAISTVLTSLIIRESTSMPSSKTEY